MGSDIQSLAIPAKGYDSVMNHAAGLTSLEILCPHLKPRSNLEALSLLSSAARKCSLPNVSLVEMQLMGAQEAIIT